MGQRRFLLTLATGLVLGLAPIWQLEAHEPGDDKGYQWQMPMMSPGYGMGPGMMMSPGMMGPGMMGPGMMMSPGYGMGLGMMMGPGYGMGPGGGRALPRDLDKEAVEHMMEHRLAWSRNPNLKLGKVEEKDKDIITAEIVTKEGSLVRRFEIDRHTGIMRPVQ